jgi:hypothetical protein
MNRCQVKSLRAETRKRVDDVMDGVRQLSN